MEMPAMEAPGTDKTGWLRWENGQAHITSLDDCLLHHRISLPARNAWSVMMVIGSCSFSSEQGPSFRALRCLRRP